MSLNVTAFTGLGDGIHEVVVTGVTTKAAKAGGDYLRWEFSDRDGKTASANTSVEMTPGNKTGKWFAALTGRPTVIGETRQIAEVIGRPCTLTMEINAEGYPKVLALTPRNAAPVARVPFVETAQADLPAPTAAERADDALPF